MSLIDDVWTVTVPCEACAPARGSAAKFAITLRTRSYGGYRGHTWQVCGSCLDSCVEAAFAQHTGPGIPAVSLLPTPVREYT